MFGRGLDPIFVAILLLALGPRSPNVHSPEVGPTRRRELLGVKMWFSTLETVYLCVFRMRH